MRTWFVDSGTTTEAARTATDNAHYTGVVTSLVAVEGKWDVNLPKLILFLVSLLATAMFPYEFLVDYLESLAWITSMKQDTETHRSLGKSDVKKFIAGETRWKLNAQIFLTVNKKVKVIILI